MSDEVLHEISEKKAMSFAEFIKDNRALVDEISGDLYCPRCKTLLVIDWFDSTVECCCDEFDLTSEMVDERHPEVV